MRGGRAKGEGGRGECGIGSERMGEELQSLDGRCDGPLRIGKEGWGEDGKVVGRGCEGGGDRM